MRQPGKWITNEATISSLCYPIRKCSQCGYEYSMTVKFKYCPNCGDKKEEEEKDVSQSCELDPSRICRDCKYAEKPVNLEPCFSCSSKLIHTSWEPKEEKND